jgi:N-acetylglucosaminyldiphosphoundecaprenol N-acetyl-beta-D-mannosaminyltransferase
MEILGVRVDNLTRDEVLEKINLFLDEEKFHQIATVNPEFVLEAQKNLEFKNILNSTSLNVADGVGLNLAFWKKGGKLKYRMTGVELMDEIIKIAQARNLSVFVACLDRGLSDQKAVKTALEGQFEGLKVGGADIDPISGYNDEIKQYNIVFVNFGAPEQEKFISSLKNQKDSKIRLAIGVGGSFDYITGKLKRAPKWMRQVGLEWLFRLIQQPHRIKRIRNAVIIFPIKILFSK